MTREEAAAKGCEHGFGTGPACPGCVEERVRSSPELLRALDTLKDVPCEGSFKAKPPDLKAVLMALGNRLVLEHGFEPSRALDCRTTGPIILLTEFLNQNTAAREVLAELGFAWSMPAETPPVERFECKKCGCLSTTHPVSPNAIGFKGCVTPEPCCAGTDKKGRPIRSVPGGGIIAECPVCHLECDAANNGRIQPH